MAPAGNPAQAVAVTNFRRHPVRFLSRAADGTLALHAERRHLHTPFEDVRQK